ncbi:MAG: hypothetical protein Q9225_003362 [Loekoesia sp. 1 TL-2023]
MSKALKKSIFGRGEGGSSKARAAPKISETDEELARKLNEELNAGHVEDIDHGHHHHGGYDFPGEIQAALDLVQRYASDVLNTACCECGRPLIRCGEEAQTGNSKYLAEYEGLKLDYCCSKGAVFIAWIVLSQYDNMELNLQARSEQHQAAIKQRQAFTNRMPVHNRLAANGVGYGGDWRTSPFQYDTIHSATAADEGYRRPGLRQALNFKQVDAETDGLTKWILGMLIELLPRRNEPTKKVSPVMGSMIEMSLLQDRVAELLRNDSLQNVDKRPQLYFATFEFVGRLGAHPKLKYLVVEDRFVKKQSAGLHAIATAGGRGKGKGKAQAFLTVASRNEGMAPSLISCLSNLATQSKVLLGGSNNAAAGGNILEVAQGVNKLYTRLAGDTQKVSTITTWKEYHREKCLVRKENVAKYLSPHMSKLASKVNNPAKGRNSRLVTEASEMTTSLPEGIFVRVDEVRPDIMKALIVGPEDTPYEGGLFEFDIVCGRDYPFTPPSVWFLTTGQGKIPFNPNLYATGKVCLSLIGTWPGAPESKWQPGASTIASVLVSIQSMILWKWPYENEPSCENAHNNPVLLPKCLSYNKVIRGDTLKYATLDWLTRKEMRDGLWRDVVRDYFRFCGKNVVESARRWEKEKSNAGMSLGTKSLFGMGSVDALEKEIEKIRKQGSRG